MENIFDINNFNVVQDEEFYYFFQAIEIEENQGIEDVMEVDDAGNYVRLKTDRERWEARYKDQTPKYSKDAPLSLEQIFDHIKINYRKDTNCISLSSNANVAIDYGRTFFQDRYIIMKVPKSKMGEKVINAGQYMLEEVEKRVNQAIAELDKDDEKNSNIMEALRKIDMAETEEQIKETISKTYVAKPELDTSKKKMRKGINFRRPHSRVSSYQALTKEQSLEKNKVIGKLTLLERAGKMAPIIPNTANNGFLIRTIGSAFSSVEIINYGDIDGQEFTEVPKEIIDIFALIQQVEGQEKNIIQDLEKEIITFIEQGKNLEDTDISELVRTDEVKKDILIDEIYELTRR